MVSVLLSFQLVKRKKKKPIPFFKSINASLNKKARVFSAFYFKQKKIKQERFKDSRGTTQDDFSSQAITRRGSQLLGVSALC